MLYQTGAMGKFQKCRRHKEERSVVKLMVIAKC